MIQPNIQQNAFGDIKADGGFTFEGNFTQIGQQNVFQQESSFFEPSLEQYKSSKFKSPKITSQLLTQFTEQRLLVLGGSPDVDKDSLAKHVASRLIEKSSFGGDEITAKEWYRSSELHNIYTELQTTKKTTVFILTQVKPHHVNKDLRRIQEAAKLRQNYVVISTNTPFAAWKQPDSTKKLFWYELLQESVADSPELINKYSQEDSLSHWYLQELASRERLLALGLCFFDDLFEEQIFAALEKIVEKVWQKRDASLRALDYCDLDNLRNFFNFTETKELGTKIKSRFPKQRRTLLKLAWTRDRRQILSALPVLVDIVRKSVGVERLTNLELYGNKTKCRAIRTAIAETISDIGSISNNSIQTTLLQLSADPNRTVQSTAANAMARWRDSEYNLDLKLFNMLHSWLSDLNKIKPIIDQIDAILKSHNKENNESLKTQDYIKVTVALTVSYAAVYDPPLGMVDSKGLSKELYDLLKKLVNDTSNVVRDTFLYNTLPNVLQIHLKQLSGWLRDTIKQQKSSSSSIKSIAKFDRAVGRSLAKAYQNEPEDTIKILENWTEEGLRNLPKHMDVSEITSRESLLATVALTYGEIECIQDLNILLTPRDIFNRLHLILKREKHPFVREAILIAIGRQARLHFDKIEPELQSLVAEVKENERENIVRTLIDIYFEQRINLSGGDYWISQKFTNKGNTSSSYKYQIWINEERPKTLIEEAMHDWIKNASNNVAQEIAVRSIFDFANLLDKHEEQEINKIKENLDRDTSPQYLTYETPPTKTHIKEFYVQQIVPWLTILLKWIYYFTLKRNYYKSFIRKWSDYRKDVANLLPVVLKLDLSSQSTMDFVLKKWKYVSDKELKIIADLLKLAILMAKNPRFVIFFPVTFFSAILIFWVFVR